MKRVHVGGDQFCVLDEGQGPPILFAHGFPLDHEMWSAQTARLARNYRVIAPDLRCFGESPAASGVVTMEQMADDLDGLLTALGVREPVVLCGLSMGGYVAWQFWRKFAHRLRGLILADTRSQADSSEALVVRQRMIDHVLRAGTSYVADAMLPKLFAKETFERLPAVVDAVRNKILAARPESIAAAVRGLSARPDVTPLLPEIDVPALVLVGEHDALSPAAEMQAMAAAIGGARFVEIAQAGHMTPLENPQAFNAAVESWLAELA